MLAALQQGAGKPGADFKALGRRQRHHGFGEVGFQLVKDWRAHPDGRIAHDALDHPPAGVAFPANGLNALDHLLGDRLVRAAHNVRFHGFEAHPSGIHVGFDGVNAAYPGDHLGAVGLGQQLFGNGASGHAANRLAGGGASTPTAGLDAVLRLVGGIGMGGPKGHLHLLVIAGPLVLVAHHHGDRGSQGDPIEQTAEDFNLVGFLARGGDFALTRFAAIQFGLDGIEVEVEPWRAAIDDHPHTAPVGFPEGADLKELAEAAAHHMVSIVGAYPEALEQGGIGPGWMVLAC